MDNFKLAMLFIQLLMLSLQFFLYVRFVRKSKRFKDYVKASTLFSELAQKLLGAEDMTSLEMANKGIANFHMLFAFRIDSDTLNSLVDHLNDIAELRLRELIKLETSKIKEVKLTHDDVLRISKNQLDE